MAASVFHGVGRRKEAIARVWMKSGKGSVVVNGKPYQEYFPTDDTRTAVQAPLKLAEKTANFDIKINLIGGGFHGQATAAQLGIARALLESDSALKPVLKGAKFLSVDSRVKERKKPGQRGARRKFQFVKR